MNIYHTLMPSKDFKPVIDVKIYPVSESSGFFKPEVMINIELLPRNDRYHRSEGIFSPEVLVRVLAFIEEVGLTKYVSDVSMKSIWIAALFRVDQERLSDVITTWPSEVGQ